MGLSTCSFAWNITVTIIYDIVTALVAAAALDASPVAQTERASRPRSIQVSIELGVSDSFSVLSGSNDDHSLSVLLNDTKKKMAESE